jgi:agmatine deiminase
MATFFKTLTFICLLPALAFGQPTNPYTVPEYAPTEAVLIEWDFNDYTWSLYSDLIFECQEAAEVICVVRDLDEENQMRQRLSDDGVPLSNISFVHVPCERMWIRDHGPFAVQTDEGVAYMDFNDKANSGMDENLPTNLANEWGLLSFERPWIFDGGNLLVDSYGNLFCTDGLYTNNPSVSPAQIDQELETYMGIKKIIPLRRQYDDYWAHIDMQIKLLDDTTFVVSSVSPTHPGFDSLELNFTFLASLNGPNNQPYRMERLPHADDWKTYANSLILNDRIIVPVYGHPNDSLALNIYKDLLPDHKVRAVNCDKIIGWEGALHCITMQLFDPAQVTDLKELSHSVDPLNIFPNPTRAQAEAYIQVASDSQEEKQLLIYNQSGQLQYQLPVHLTPGENLIALPKSLPAGQYNVVVRGEKGIEKRGSWVVVD